MKEMPAEKENRNNQHRVVVMPEKFISCFSKGHLRNLMQLDRLFLTKKYTHSQARLKNQRSFML